VEVVDSMLGLLKLSWYPLAYYVGDFFKFFENLSAAQRNFSTA